MWALPRVEINLLLIYSAHIERAIHVLGSRPKPGSDHLPKHTSDKQSHEDPFRSRVRLQDLWREHHPPAEPRERNFPPAAHSQTSISPLHNTAYVRVLLHQRSPRPSRYHTTEFTRPSSFLYSSTPHVPPRPISSTRPHTAEVSTALQAK